MVGQRQQYRLIDFKRDKDGIPGRVERLEYDPNRTALLHSLHTMMARKDILLHLLNLEVDAVIVSGADSPIR